jgi:hypothetical protein
MIKLFSFILAVVVMVGCTTSNQVPAGCQTYVEATLPGTVQSDWSSVAKGLQASFGSIDRRYEKHEIPGVEAEAAWSGSAWSGERVSAQMVLWSKDSIEQVQFRFSDLVSTDGKTISAAKAQARFVRYVITDEFADGCGKRDPANYASSLSADVLDQISCFNMSPRTALPVWITFDVPADAAPGVYTSTLQMMAKGEKSRVFTLTLEVLPQTLPAPAEWKFHLDLWQNPYATARIEGVEPWSEAHWKALYPVMKMLANAGQKVITATLNKDPWNGQTQDAYGSMIGWTKKSDGTWQYDYTVFDQWVQFMMDLGIRDQINCYSMVPWGNIFYYYDEQQGQEIKVSAAPGTPEYAGLWKPFLTDFISHLDQKGWREITRIAMDERAPAEMQAMLKLLSEVAPGMGVALADNHKSYKLYPDVLTDLCVSHGATVEPQDRMYRAQKGYVTTWYVCCGHKFPNVFTFSAPAEAAFIGWHTMAMGLDGFLRWAYDSWVKEPLLDSRFRTWPAGDTYIVYPGGRSSIRFERLIEGIQDAEKIRILRESLQADSSEEAKVKLQQLNDMISLFDVTSNPGDLEGLLAKGKKLLETLSRP